MSVIGVGLTALGLELAAPLTPPPGVVLPFSPVLIRGDRAIVSGHGPQQFDGSLAGPLGKVGADVTSERAYLGDLDRIVGFGRVFGTVNVAREIECEVTIR